MRLIPTWFLILALLSSCIGPSALQHSLGEYKVPLDYTFDSNLDTIKGDCKIHLKIIDKLSLNDTTKVTENGFFIMPLIIAGGYKYDFTVTLGKKVCSLLFQNSYITPFKRVKDQGTLI